MLFRKNAVRGKHAREEMPESFGAVEPVESAEPVRFDEAEPVDRQVADAADAGIWDAVVEDAGIADEVDAGAAVVDAVDIADTADEDSEAVPMDLFGVLEDGFDIDDEISLGTVFVVDQSGEFEAEAAMEPAAEPEIEAAMEPAAEPDMVAESVEAEGLEPEMPIEPSGEIVEELEPEMEETVELEPEEPEIPEELEEIEALETVELPEETEETEETEAADAPDVPDAADDYVEAPEVLQEAQEAQTLEEMQAELAALEAELAALEAGVVAEAAAETPETLEDTLGISDIEDTAASSVKAAEATAPANEVTALAHKRGKGLVKFFAKHAAVSLGGLAKTGVKSAGRGAIWIARHSADAAVSGTRALASLVTGRAKANAMSRTLVTLNIEELPGGVCAAQGYRAAGINCGLRKDGTKNDLALILSDFPASVASVHTTNRVVGAPNIVSKRHAEDGCAQAIICNSVIANTCAENGVEIAEKICESVASELKIPADDVLVASTGVIGPTLDVDAIQAGIPALVGALGYVGADGVFGSTEAEHAIMTTDTKEKQCAFEFTLDGKTCRIGGIAKGSGMINPNMATMLSFITTDVAIAPELLQQALSEDVKTSFNMVSVDGDTSTNDMVVVLANGKAGNERILSEGSDYQAFTIVLNMVTTTLARMIAADGEGATKLLECRVTGAKDDATARTIAKSVISSNLLKAAMFGSDANWGRVLAAIGYSGADVDVTKVDVAFSSPVGTVDVCRAGAGVDFSERKAKRVLKTGEIAILIDLADGGGEAIAWGCDLTYEYVKINGDYRS